MDQSLQDMSSEDARYLSSVMAQIRNIQTTRPPGQIAEEVIRAYQAGELENFLAIYGIR